MPATDELASTERSARVSVSGTVSVIAGIAAAWIAAGSTGLLVEPLRIVVTWLALLTTILVLPSLRACSRGLALGCVALALVPLVLPVAPQHELLLVVAVLAVLATGQDGARRTTLQVATAAVFSFALFRLACDGIPQVWWAANALGSLLGHGFSRLGGRPIEIGATFAGVDFLVLTSAFCAAASTRVAGSEKDRWRFLLWSGAAIVVGHVVYLLLLAFSLDLANKLPIPPPEEFIHPYVPPNWSWAGALRRTIPWNVPAWGAAIHLVVLGFVVRWSSWSDEEHALEATASFAQRLYRLAPLSPWVLAVLLPISTTYSPAKTDLTGKRLVAHRTGFLDWQRPQRDLYGEASAGGMGMLPLLVQSLGGELAICDGLSAEDLADADVLMLLYPANDLSDAVRQRVWDYVRQGGSLLIVGGPHQQQSEWQSGWNQWLAPTAISIRQDVAISRTANWQHACQRMNHPATYGMDTTAGHVFTDSAASIRLGWGSRPLVVGRWGWSDPGSDAVLTGQYGYEAGERLGDLVLAAEQRVGRGRLVALGDGYSLSNEGAVRGYRWTGRLLSYLANRPANPQTRWRTLVSLSLAGILLALLCRAPSGRIGCVAIVLALATNVCGEASRRASCVVPDGRLLASTNDSASGVAYIDASHMEAYSDLDWGFEGINGLALTLMREGYLTLALPEITPDRLERAALVVSVAPAQPFSARERQQIVDFVAAGGLLICTTGAEEAVASNPLLAEFDLHVSPSPIPTDGTQREPEPMGRFRSLYLDARDFGGGDYRAGVLFFAGWPVEMRSSEGQILARGQDDVPIVIARAVGRQNPAGVVVVIGDSGFALNKNLEYITGEPFEGKYENAHFWRWLLSRITAAEEWVPPLEAAGHAIEAEEGSP